MKCNLIFTYDSFYFILPILTLIKIKIFIVKTNNKQIYIDHCIVLIIVNRNSMNKINIINK